LALHDRKLVSRHYDREDLGAAILSALRAAGLDPERITPDDLAPVDQFHIGGRNSTLELMRLSGLEPGMSVLDVGGGVGGPARTLATEIQCRVCVLDLSDAYCRAGEMLTERVGLADRVTFRQGDALALPFPPESFDAGWTQHSTMNIENKEALYAGLHRVLRPGARLAMHEVTAGPVQPIHFPVPWARGSDISFLRPAEAMRSLLAAAGFRELAWIDVTATALAWGRQRRAVASAMAESPPLGIHVILGPDARAMTANVLRNLEEGRIEIFGGLFERC
jgi:SAM-dependent methyltransferase